MNPSNTSPLLRGLLSRPSTSSAPPPPLEPLHPSSSAPPPSTSPAPPPSSIQDSPPVIHLSDDEEWESTLISTAFPNFWDPDLQHLVVEEVLGTTEYRRLGNLAPPPSLPEQDLTPSSLPSLPSPSPATAEDIPSSFPSLPSSPPATAEDMSWREFSAHLPATPPSSPPSSPLGAHLPATPRSSLGSPLPPEPTSLLSPLPSSSPTLGAHLPATPSPPPPSSPASPPGAPHTMPRRRITRRQLWSNWCYRVWRWERTGNHNTVFLFDVGDQQQILELPLPRSIRPTRAQREHHLFTSHIYLRKEIINGRSFITFHP